MAGKRHFARRGLAGLLCGFDIIECANLDDAIQVAARHPATASGAIEARPLWQE
jgi:hypothetical protein